MDRVSRAEDVSRTVNLTQEPPSLEFLADEDDESLGDSIVSKDEVVLEDTPLERIDLRRKTNELLCLVKPGAEWLLRLRFGVGQPRCYTLDDVASSPGICRERVRQIEKRVLRRLRDRCETGVRQ